MRTTVRMTLPHAVGVPVLLVALIVLGGMFWWPGAVADRVPGGRVMDGTPRTTYAQLPHGALEITTTRGQKVVSESSSHTVRGGSQWVGVSWRARSASGLVVWPGAKPAEREEPSSRIILRAGGSSIVVADRLRSTSGSGSIAVRVEDPADLQVVVATDGMPTQLPKDEAQQRSRTAKSPGGQVCSASGAGSVRHALRCSLRLERASYVMGLGGAPAGQEWLIVTHAGVEPTSPGAGSSAVVGKWRPERGGVVDYVASGKPRLSLRVSGAGRPEKTFGRDVRTAHDARLAARAYLVPASKEAVVTMSYRTAAVPGPDLDPRSGAPAKQTVSVRSTVQEPG